MRRICQELPAPSRRERSWMGKEESRAPVVVERGVMPALGDPDGPSGKENGT